MADSGSFRRKMLGDGDVTVSTAAGDVTPPGENFINRLSMVPENLVKNGPSEQAKKQLWLDRGFKGAFIRCRCLEQLAKEQTKGVERRCQPQI